MNIGPEPGLCTDEYLPFGGSGLTYPDLAKAGFTWVSYQVYNPELYPGTKDFDLKAVRDHGFKSVGIWGGVYSKNDFYNCGRTLGQAAVRMQADHILINAEEIYKYTDGTGAGKDFIAGTRAGGWTREVSLLTLGAPWSPMVNDYHMDLNSFLNTGGTIISEAYLNESEGYSPELCKQYMDRLGVPGNKQNYMLGLYPGQKGKIAGKEWLPHLRDAGITKAFSIYMIQHLTIDDVAAFSGWIKTNPTVPPSPDTPTAAQTRINIVADADDWLRANPKAADTTRIKTCRRIAQVQNTDNKWNQVNKQIDALLDKAGIP